VLDLMQPLAAARQLISLAWEARRDEPAGAQSYWITSSANPNQHDQLGQNATVIALDNRDVLPFGLLVHCRMTLRASRHKDAAKCWNHEQAAKW
jgi:hypothetical protein